MKKFQLVLFGAVLLYSSLLFSFVVADKVAEDLWKRLGINRQEGSDKIRNSFLDGYFHYEGVSAVKNLALNDRQAIAKDLVTYAKQYLGTPGFKTEYDKMRAMAKPVERADRTQTKEQVRQKQIDEMKKAITNMEAVAKTLPAANQKDFKASIEMYKKNIKEYEDPKNQMIELMYQGQLEERQKEVKDLKDATKKWEAEYPVEVKAFIKGRLQHYLDVAATVDFSAELVEKYGKKRFVNQTYQSKSNEWKMIFRAGKDTYEATKVFIDGWMKEL